MQNCYQEPLLASSADVVHTGAAFSGGVSRADDYTISSGGAGSGSGAVPSLRRQSSAKAALLRRAAEDIEAELVPEKTKARKEAESIRMRDCRNVVGLIDAVKRGKMLAAQAALQAATCFTLHSLRAAPLHLKAVDWAQLSLWWFGLASHCATAPGAHLSPGALLWRVARLRYAESVGRQGEPVSWMEL